MQLLLHYLKHLQLSFGYKFIYSVMLYLVVVYIHISCLLYFYTYVCASVFSIHITDKHTYILIVTFLNIDDHFDLSRYIYIFAGIGTQILF